MTEAFLSVREWCAMGKKQGAVASAQKAVKRNVKNVKRAKRRYDEIIEWIAKVIGGVGLVALILFGVAWGLREFTEVELPIELSRKQLLNYTIISVFCASFLGWLVVSDGQERIERRSNRILMLIVFLMLPVLCLISSVFPSLSIKAAELAGASLPEQSESSNHPFWLFVRYFPILLIAVCLVAAFRKEAMPGKHVKKKRALKFACFTAPYVILIVFQELSLKNELVKDALDATPLAAIGVNVPLIFAILTSTSYE